MEPIVQKTIDGLLIPDEEVNRNKIEFNHNNMVNLFHKMNEKKTPEVFSAPKFRRNLKRKKNLIYLPVKKRIVGQRWIRIKGPLIFKAKPLFRGVKRKQDPWGIKSYLINSQRLKM